MGRLCRLSVLREGAPPESTPGTRSNRRQAPSNRRRLPSNVFSFPQPAVGYRPNMTECVATQFCFFSLFESGSALKVQTVDAFRGPVPVAVPSRLFACHPFSLVNLCWCRGRGVFCRGQPLLRAAVVV